MVVDVIVLSPDEKFIAWLDTTVVDLKETNEATMIKEVQLQHILTEDVELSKWYRQGNKIWVGGGNGLKPCLYVINQDYELDTWEDQTVSLRAEEVLVELNNVELYTYTGSSPITVNSTFLTNVFGDYYTIKEIDSFVNRQNNQIQPVGTMTLIELLRLIETETGMVFVTEYELSETSNNVIKRYLSLKQPGNVGYTFTQALDVGRNLDNITCTVDETDTIRGVSPKFSLNEDNSATSSTSMTKAELAAVINAYKTLEVTKGTSIPMIIEKQVEGNVETEVVTAYWYAPFTKQANKLYVEDDSGPDSDYSTTEANYNQIYSKKDNATLKKVPKLGTISTSETNKYLIYNACARELMEKRYPEVHIDVKLADLNLMLGDHDSSYNVFDKVFVKVPGYNTLIEAYVTKTVKDPLDVGNNQITISNAKVGTKVTQVNTSITIDNLTDNTVTINKKGTALTGTLFSEGVALPGEVVSISFQKYVEEKTPDIDVQGVELQAVTTKKAKTKTITEKVKRTDVITASGYNTCSCCAYPKNPYKKVKRTYLNKCPHCGKTMVLKDNPKKCKDGEITCSSCGADYCINCGGDKKNKTWCKKWKLTPASEYTTVTREVPITTATAKTDSSKNYDKKDPTASPAAQKLIKKYGVPSLVVAKAKKIGYGKTTDTAKLRAIADWMGLGSSGNIKYQKYECLKRGASGTLTSKKGNCADQAALAVALARAMGIKSRYVHRKGHFYGEYYINKSWFIMDTVTSKGWGHYWNGSGALISKGYHFKGCKVY